MRLHLDRPIDLSYCTNVHPGETWAETFESIRQWTERIRERVAPGERFGIGLRLSNDASVELSVPEKLKEFRDYLNDKNLYVFTLNGFPYGKFHQTRVKENVFRPDWTQRERLDYTVRLARILAELIPEGEMGSISTLPGSFKEFITGEDQVTTIIQHLAECACELEKISQETGRSIELGLEPEPVGLIETTEETAEFFTKKLRPTGAQWIAKNRGISAEEAEALLRHRIGMCYDTCHMALEYETAQGGLDRLAAADIRVNKIQVSSALRLIPTATSLAELERYVEGVYLHQVLARMDDGRIERWRDIAPALADRERLMEANELRVHCHVPLFMTENRGLDSTADFIPETLRALAGGNTVAHFELETYTWDVLPPELRELSLDEAVAREFEWFLDRFKEIGRSQPT